MEKNRIGLEDDSLNLAMRKKRIGTGEARWDQI